MRSYCAILLLLYFFLMPTMALEAGTMAVPVDSLGQPNLDSLTAYTKYIKTETALVDFRALSTKRKFVSRRAWLEKALKSTGLHDTLTIPLSTDNRVVRVLRNKKTGRTYQEVLGINREELNEIFNSGDVTEWLASKKLHDTFCADTTIRLRRFGVFGHFTAKRSVAYTDFSTDSLSSKEFRFRSRLKYHGMADYRPSQFWTRYDTLLSSRLRRKYVEDSLYKHTIIYDSTGVIRHSQTAIQEDVCTALDYATHKVGWGLNFVTIPAKAFINNYIEIGHKPVFDISPVVSIFSFNTEDGFRLRLGGKTTANLFKRFFMGGYLAYGFKSHNVYGMAKALYSFINKTYDENEFPHRSISFTYRNDICPLGERNLHTDHDNLFRSYEWGKNSNMMFFNLQQVEFQWDMRNGIGFLTALRREEDSATAHMDFHTFHELRTYFEEGKEFTSNGSVCTTELRFEMMYTPPSMRFSHRKPIAPDNRELPEMGISHNIGIYILGGDYHYHLSELLVRKNWYLGNLGTARTTFRAGYLWNRVPFPVLLAPHANVSYISDYDSFEMINRSEFLVDRYLQFNAYLETNGNLIGLIPIIKRLRWKEFIGVRMLLGALSDKNNPELPQNFDSHTVMPFPYNSYLMDGSTPYIEAEIGIHNILHVINLDYVFRCNYRSLLGAATNGFRFTVHF